MAKKKIIGQATAEQIKECKDRYGYLLYFKVDDDNDVTHICYLRTPKQKDLSAASVASKVDPLKFNEVILRQCWLGGDEAIRIDDRMFLSVSGKIPDIIEVAEAELEKL